MTVAASGLGRHLLDVDQLTRDDFARIFEAARTMREARAARRRLDDLRGETVGLLFYEPSTRTRVGFEVAATALGADVVEVAVGSSSVVKGESFVDTLQTLERLGITLLVLRHQAAGAPYLAARVVRCGVLNAGDGAHAHPTQALLDAFTLAERLGPL